MKALPLDSPALAAEAEERSGGEMVVDALIRCGVQHAFGIPGVHNLPIYDALEQKGAIETYVTRNEQGAAFMADGYARVTRRPGVALVTTGPGLTNTVTPLAGAWSDSVPVLVIGTAGDTALQGKSKGYLHEYKDQHGIMDAAAGSNLVASVDELEGAVQDALVSMQSGRVRPRSIEVPIDILLRRSEASAPELPPVSDIPDPDEAAISRTAKLLHEARYPIIFAGGGAAKQDDSSLLLRIAELVRAPVITSVNGKGAIPDSSLWSAGCTWRSSSSPTVSYPPLFKQADTGLVIGARLTAMSTKSWNLPLPENLVHLDIDEREIGKNYPVADRIVGDAAVAIPLLIAELERLGPGASQWDPNEVRAARDADEAAGAELSSDGIELIRGIREGLKDDGILVCDQAIACYWAVRHFQVDGPRRFLYPTGSAVLGFGLPVGIGAQIGAPDSQVCVLAGDGGFLFTGTELATAVQYELRMTIVIVNDNAYGVIKAEQRHRYNGRVRDTDLRNPDFVAFARSFGAHAERLTRPGDVAAGLVAARDRKGPTVLVLEAALRPPYH